MYLFQSLFFIEPNSLFFLNSVTTLVVEEQSTLGSVIFTKNGLLTGGSSNGSEQHCLKDKDLLKSGGSSASESDLVRTHGHGGGRRSGGSRSRSSGSEQSVATTTTTPPQQGSSVASGPTVTGTPNAEDISGSRQSFRMAMGNPCEFFVDVM